MFKRYNPILSEKKGNQEMVVNQESYHHVKTTSDTVAGPRNQKKHPGKIGFTLFMNIYYKIGT